MSAVEIHKENLRAEAELGRIRSLDRGAEDKDSVDRTSHLNTYYQSLRNNVITLLENVRIPHQGQQYGGGLGTPAHHPHHPSQQYPPHPQTQQPGYPPPHYYNYPGSEPTVFGDRVSTENFDSYLTKLQTLCGTTNNNNNNNGPPAHDIEHESSAPHQHQHNKPLYETVRNALQDFSVLPTPI